MLQVRCNEDGTIFDEVETLEQGIARIDELIEEDKANGEPYEKGFYEVHNPETLEQLYVK